MLTLEMLVRSLTDSLTDSPGRCQICLHPDDWRQLLLDNVTGKPLRIPFPRQDGYAATWSPVRMRYGKTNRRAAWDHFLIQVYGESVGVVYGVDVYLDSTLQRGDFTIHYPPESKEDTQTWEPREPEEDSRSSRSL